MNDIIKLEYVLSAYARPIFLAITNPDDDNDIQIVISTLAFKTMAIPERVTHIYNLIKTHAPSVLKDRLVIIQAYNPEEMEEVLNELFIPQAFEE